VQGRADSVQPRIQEDRRRDAHCGYPIEFSIIAESDSKSLKTNNRSAPQCAAFYLAFQTFCLKQDYPLMMAEISA
jgi:hypothetical protein